AWANGLTDGLLNGLTSHVVDDQSVDLPETGSQITFTDWRWIQVAGTDAISSVSAAFQAIRSQYDGTRYRLADSNVFVNSVLTAAGINLTQSQQTQLGWRPTFR